MLGTILVIIIGLILLSMLGFWLVGERGKLLRPSTWKTMKELGLKRIFNLQSLHGYVYGRWNHQYIKFMIHDILPRLKSRGKKWLSDRYHGKVLTQEQAKAIITLNQDIPLRDLEQVIPYPMARDLVLKGPPDVVVHECGCRHSRTNPCRPTRVCMVIGQPFADFMLEHHPRRSHRITQSEALELLQAEHDRGHMHSAWFKDACLDRFIAICNCCKCCCGGIEAMTKYGVPMLASSGYVSQVDRALCTASGTCVKACPFNAISLNADGIARDWQKCMGCGVCIDSCPNHARSLIRDEDKGVPLDVRLLA
jgi:Pyruvate/2-oxoacid:ferredoxin oxidoreductase delta subunit